MGFRLAIKEWAGVIDALASGDQFLFIRKYSPEESRFLLYPTYSYYTSTKGDPERFDAKFQESFRQIARDAALAELEDTGVVRLRYLFEVDEIKIVSRDFPVQELTPFMIWSSEHVSNYAEKAYNGLFLWIGRTQQLSVPVLAARQTTGGSITTYKHFEDIELADTSYTTDETLYLEKRNALLQIIENSCTAKD